MGVRGYVEVGPKRLQTPNRVGSLGVRTRLRDLVRESVQ